MKIWLVFQMDDVIRGKKGGLSSVADLSDMTDLSQIHHSVGCVGDSSKFHGKGKKDDFVSVINS